MAEPPGVLRVCADPASLPYSDAAAQGFENRIARVVAEAMDARLEFVWLPQGRGTVRRTLGAGRCDVLVGVPVGLERVLTTRPYYRSGYVFVNRADATQPLVSFGDPRLAVLRIGVPLIGDDGAATPPGHALARRGAVDRVVGYPWIGAEPAAARMIDDVAAGRLDAALVWGPQAGHFAKASRIPLRLTPADAPADLDLPFTFAIAMGVRPQDAPLRDALDRALDARQAAIEAILDDDGVPRLAPLHVDNPATVPPPTTGASP